MGSTTTHFWRHADQLRLLMRHVGARPARVCSLACGTGEEPYTIAIAAHHAFGADALWRISGVDSDGAALSRAREGSFNAWSFRRVPSWFLARYFVEDAQRGASVAPFVRAQVRFQEQEPHAYLAGQRRGTFDAILLRETGRLTQTEREAAVQEARRALRVGGLLCLAPQSEAPAGFVEIDAQLGVWGVRSPPRRPRRRDAAVSLEAAPGDAPGGRMERALELASALIERTPRAAAAHLLRGTMNFEAQRFDDAVADLGRCLQLAPEHCMARYWFGAALLCSGDSRRGADELEHLRTRLGRMAPIALLEDAETSAHELSDAAQQLLARLA